MAANPLLFTFNFTVFLELHQIASPVACEDMAGWSIVIIDLPVDVFLTLVKTFQPFIPVMCYY